MINNYTKQTLHRWSQPKESAAESIFTGLVMLVAVALVIAFFSLLMQTDQKTIQNQTPQNHSLIK